MAMDRAGNFRRRFEYLDAITTYWPEVLSSLRDAAAEQFAACMAGSDDWPSTFSGLRNHATETGKDGVLRLLEAWTRDHGIPDPWLLDAAVQTLDVWCRGDYDARWHYIAQEMETPTFNPVLDALWIPPREKWTEFKARVDKLYRKQLGDYRDTVARLWDADAESIDNQAIWTVLWQQGKTAGQIQLWEFQNHRRTVTQANIMQRVNEFAASIGLTMRESKHSLKK